MKPIAGILFTMAVALSATVATTSCGSDDGYSDTVTVYDIVRLEEQTELEATFTMQKPLAVETVTYRSFPVIDTAAVHVGDRLLLAYVPTGGVPYVSGAVTVRGYSPINNDTVAAGYISKYPEWNRDGVYLMSAWLSGDYLNIHCRLTYDTEPRLFKLMADSLSIDSQVAECYLMHALKEPADNFKRSYYASFDVGRLRRRGHTALRLHLNNTNLPVDTYTFEFLINNP